MLASGQVSIEAIAAGALLFVAFLIIILQTGNMQEVARGIEGEGAQQAECLKLSSAISLVQAESGNARLQTQIFNDANIAGNFIEFSDYYCEFYGQKINSEISAGLIEIKKVGGVLSVQNI
ncbi:MAG TPA: hypothetical protein VJG83_03365 [archaeon]|nr:hypothetical protein [archaeon]